MLDTIIKNSFLFLSKSKTLTKIMKQFGIRFGASRFVAGETIEEAIDKVYGLNKKGLKVTLDYLGEFVDNEREANQMADECICAIEMIGLTGVDSEISLKLTSVGLGISNKVVMNNMYRIMDVAKEHDVFVTIDMENFDCCERTLNIYRRLRKEYDNVGTVMQAYLYRTDSDLSELNEMNPNLRLVKGAYKEHESVAYPLKSDVDENYKRLIKTNLLNGNFTAIASHDENIIQYTRRLAWEHHIPKDQFEFQMLYGIRSERQEEIVKEGYNMRVYVPFGTDWYGYFMRRLAERPANVAFVLKGMFQK